MHRADKAVLRLAIGLGLAVLIAYGFALTGAFVVCVLAVLLLCKPGPPIPFVKGAIFAVVVAVAVAVGAGVPVGVGVSVAPGVAVGVGVGGVPVIVMSRSF